MLQVDSCVSAEAAASPWSDGVMLNLMQTWITLSSSAATGRRAAGTTGSSSVLPPVPQNVLVV